MFFVLHALLLLFTTVLVHIASTNPNPSAATDYVANENIVLRLAISIGPQFGKLFIWLCTFSQVLYLCLQAAFPSWTSPYLLALTPMSVFGYILVIVGGLGRIWCYKTLGAFFTYELTIRPSHLLIKTGPYAYVRHPSYTFVALLTIGMFLVQQPLAKFFPNSPWIQVQLGPVGLVSCCALLIFLFSTRVRREEIELEKKFGKEWIEYASKTTRFIPGLI